MDFRRILNRDAEGNQGQNANTIQQRLTELLRSYDRSGGSSTTDLWELRRRFANIIPFDDPFFLPKFSDFGLSARELDQQNGRATFQLGGVIPAVGLPIEYTPPVVLHPDAFAHFVPRFRRQNPFRDQQPPPIPPRPRLPPIIPRAENAYQQAVGNAGAAAINAANQLRPALPPLRDVLNPLGLTAEEHPVETAENVASTSKKRHRHKHCKSSSKTKRRRKKSSSPSSSSSSSLSSSDSSSDSDDVVDTLPFAKAKNHISGPLPVGAQDIADAVKAYRKAGWAVSIDKFNLEPNRPLGFPFSLVPALLRGHYICPVKVLWPDEYDAKKSPKPTDTFTSIRHFFPNEREWRRVIDLIGAAIVFGFPTTEDDMRRYLEHIYDMLNLFAEHGDWSQIVDYDARMRLAFATRPALSFGDFNSPALLAVRTFATSTGIQRQRPTPSAAQPTYASHAVQNATPQSYASSSARPFRETTHAPKRRNSQASTPRPVWHGNIKPTTLAEPDVFTMCATSSDATRLTPANSTTTSTRVLDTTIKSFVLQSVSETLTK
ncbi:uncharacterized protein MELLADRAFT_108073 [Melampsora larici-populina 98AG31]|uniref:Uncharacterized protein n=1 Tax=Melampsora larici-populina (strain 98AG31 / pathotype 3-4-7) TaxID=747676 RepID=F4RRV7_MELLP|nr:uncharacterized protein MELLADRAFT_108073 [Melampsora larici-populina 98AG31]EGG04746.1 hypothetical protein MELLADRAFT_108073 [Melampsora larici-populina 98AG31]